MRIILRVDSSTKMGAGHLMRCLTLADELQNKSHQIIFICRELTGNLIDLAKQKYQVLVLPSVKDFQSNHLYLDWLGATQEMDAQQTIKVLPKDVDYLIVDSYALDKVWHKTLKLFTKKIIVIDDLADRKFDCDILLNQNLGSKKEDYKNKIPNHCSLLLGCDYALLRPEFAKSREKVLEKREKTKVIKNILVSTGGSDNKNITYNILQQLDNKFNIIVALGSSSPHNEMIKDYANNKNITVVINANNMAELMFDADLAIGAGGSTSWERCCLGLPTLLYITAENQRKIANALENSGAVKIIKNLKEDLQKINHEFVLWKEMSKKSRNICDGLGSARIVNKLC